MSNNVSVTYVAGGCGVRVLHSFEHIYPNRGGVCVKDLAPQQGAGYVCAGFVNTEGCRRVYEEMCERYKLVYQSEVRVNSNSGRDFFFAVWDLRS